MNMLKDIKTKPEFPFYVKLQEWYGNRINGKKFDILHTYENDGELNTVIFMMEIDNQIEIARIFYLNINWLSGRCWYDARSEKIN